MVAEPIRIGTIENSAKKQSHDSKQYRVYSPEGKATTLCGEGGGLGAKTGLYAAPVRVGTMPNADGEITGGQAHRIYDASGKAVALCARPNGGGPETGLYAYPAGEAQGAAWRGRDDGSAYEVRTDGKANALTASGHQSRLVVTNQNGEDLPVYEVVNGEIEIKGKKYPIKLPDGYYVIRKLTPMECERLQTLPDGYTSAVSATQRYRGLGNGWTAEVIIHTTDLSDAPEEIKEQIIENDRALKERDAPEPATLPEGFNVVDQLAELLAERKKLHIIDEENLRYNCDIIALEYAIGALRR